MSGKGHSEHEQALQQAHFFVQTSKERTFAAAANVAALVHLRLKPHMKPSQRSIIRLFG